MTRTMAFLGFWALGFALAVAIFWALVVSHGERLQPEGGTRGAWSVPPPVKEDPAIEIRIE